MELGRVDTFVLILSKNQSADDLQQIPDNRGSTLYRLLTDPDNVNLEYLSSDLFLVSFIFLKLKNFRILIDTIISFNFCNLFYNEPRTFFFNPLENDETNKTSFSLSL